MNTIDILDVSIIAGALVVAVLAAIARRRILKPTDRIKMRAAAW
jgi:HAMP domain-containing protein